MIPRSALLSHILLFTIVIVSGATLWTQSENSPATSGGPAAIQDNSFLVEEAYNQEAGVV